MQMKEFSLSVVVPAYNEALNIAPFYARTSAVLENLTPNWEILFVNDGSSDGTLAAMRVLRGRDQRVKFINLSRNFGKEIALTAGLDFATGDAVIPIDVDLQDPPELIPEMVRLWQDGNDMVYAVRTSREGESWLKKTSAGLFYRFINRVSNIEIPRNTGDFRLLDKRVLAVLAGMRERNRFMKGLFSWVGFRQASLHYTRQPRAHGSSKFNLWKLWNFAIEGITGFSNVPLQIASYLGVMASLFAFCYAAVILGKTLLLGADVPGYPSIMVTILFLGGVQLLFIGIIGEYLGRIYNEVKGRPLYIIESQDGLDAESCR